MKSSRGSKYSHQETRKGKGKSEAITSPSVAEIIVSGLRHRCGNLLHSEPSLIHLVITRAAKTGAVAVFCARIDHDFLLLGIEVCHTALSLIQPAPVGSDRPLLFPILFRKCPTFKDHYNETGMEITADQIHHFQNEGFLILENFFDEPELSAEGFLPQMARPSHG